MYYKTWQQNKKKIHRSDFTSANKTVLQKFWVLPILYVPNNLHYCHVQMYFEIQLDQH